MDSVQWLKKVSPSPRPRWGGQGSNIRCVGNGRVSVNYTTALRVIYDHELLLYRDAEHLVAVDDIEYMCPADSFIIIPPGRWHYTLNPSGREGHQYWCHFNWTWQGDHGETPVMCFAPAEPAYHLCRQAPEVVPEGVLYGRLVAPDRCFALAGRMADLMDTTSPHDHMLAAAVLWELLIEALGKTEGECPTPRSDVSLASRIRDVLDRAALKQPEEPAAQLLLESFDYSYETLCRAFTKAYAIPPTRYLRAQKVIQAKILLRNTDLQIAEIAYRTGFGSASYFTKVFGALTGATPTEFRTRGRRMAPDPDSSER